jgi:hypothetical protein
MGLPICSSKIGGSMVGIKNINRSQIHECGNRETEHYNSVLEITLGPGVSFLGIHKSEPVIYIGFSTALHLQFCNHACSIKVLNFFNPLLI